MLLVKDFVGSGKVVVFFEIVYVCVYERERERRYEERS